MANAKSPARLRQSPDENGRTPSRLWQNYFNMAAAAVANQTETVFSFIGVTGLNAAVSPPADAANASVPVAPAMVSPAIAVDSGMQFARVYNYSPTGAGIYVRFSQKVASATAASATVGTAPAATDVLVPAGGTYEHPGPFHILSVIGDNDAALQAYSVQVTAYW